MVFRIEARDVGVTKSCQVQLVVSNRDMCRRKTESEGAAQRGSIDASSGTPCFFGGHLHDGRNQSLLGCLPACVCLYSCMLVLSEQKYKLSL